MRESPAECEWVDSIVFAYLLMYYNTQWNGKARTWQNLYHNVEELNPIKRL